MTDSRSGLKRREKRMPPQNTGRNVKPSGDRIGKKIRQKVNLFSVRAGLDIPFLFLILVLVSIGLVMLFSSSYAYAYHYYADSFYFIKRQALFAIAGIVLMIAISYFDYHHFHKFTIPVLVLAWILLGVVMALPGTKGVHRWINLGALSVQPSEIAKFALILWFAHFISVNFKRMNTFKIGVLPHLFVVVITVGLVVIEPHLSASVILLLISTIMLFVGGVKKKWFIIAFVVVAIAAVLYLTFKEGYANDRIAGWLDPFNPEYIKDETWQTSQSLLSIGSGGLFGLGFGQSRQKYLYLPEPQNDFIFAIVCEELGLIGALLIIILFILLIWRGITLSLRAKDKFGMLLGVGLTTQVGLQVILNIMVVTNTIPNTGISLPFFSYGGTSLIILLAQMGIVLSISRTSAVERS